MDWVLVAVLAAHLLAVNLAGAAPLVCLWLDWRAVARNDARADAAGRWLLRQSLVWLSAGIALGLAALGLVWMIDWERFVSAASRIPPSRYWYGVGELAFYYVCTGGYLALWRAAAPPVWKRAWGRRALGFLSGTNLLYHFPPLFTVIGVFGARSERLDDALDFRAAMIDPEVLALSLHHVLSSFAVVGVAMMGHALTVSRDDSTTAGAAMLESPSLGAAAARREAIWGAWLALVPTLLQLLVGTWVLLSMPPLLRDRLLGQDGTATVLFVAALVAALALLHRLAAIALGDIQRREIIGSMALLLMVVVLMVGALQRVRKPLEAPSAARYDRTGVIAAENVESL